MLFLNMIFLSLVTVSSILYTYKNRSELACMDGMIIAVAIGMVVGFISGKMISLTASIEGVMAGVMGGLMSPMLGAMLSHPLGLIWFLDFAYIFVFNLIVFLVKEARQAFLEEAIEVEKKTSSLS
ncbi:hypothetical protein [Brevibacillus brevis]|uniref:hypothetical protein n=1 Tax=Brevibacillus brevis TaxID=1393 RepID=UPI001C8DFE76|nr:hypothetical protein [Brevibacillus brevis]MBY0085345.1 hypothetical protein [Brevibacillus brevis]